jgi:hypothetical protein
LRLVSSLQLGAAMRALAVIVLVCGCAVHRTVWTPVAPRDVPDGGQAFVIVGGTAIHLAHVETTDGLVHGRVVHAWALPRAGVTAIGGTDKTSPEQIARRAGWPEVGLARRVKIPLDQISSVRADVDVEPDPPDESAGDDSTARFIGVAAASVVEYMLTPRCRCCR